MSVLEVLDPGMQSSVQDLGRHGYSQFGVPRSGAFDTKSLLLGNSLLANDPSDAAIELTMIGGSYRVHRDTIACVIGANAPDLCVEQAGQRTRIKTGRAYELRTGVTIHVGRLQEGIRCYLCLSGGIQIEPLLGSRSTLVSLPTAGLGRALCKGDTLPLVSPHPIKGARVETPLCTPTSRIRIVPGMHWAQFDEQQRSELIGSVFQVSNQSNRAGVRLKDAAISGPIPQRIPSIGMLPGFIQVPPSGAPIILGVDGPTMGGYPVIASVIHADMHRIGQAAPRDELRFEWVSIDKALELLREEEASI